MIQSACCTNIGTRSENEDRVLLKQDNHKLAVVVADGLGGQGGGREAAGIAVECLCDFIDAENYQEWIHSKFSQANEEILENQRPGKKMMSTAVGLYLEEDLAVWAHMGDSRLYHFFNGVLSFQTCDHSVSQMAVFRKEITQREIRFHEDRNRVLRALGGGDEAREEMNSIRLKQGFHAFLLCSDGFWEHVLEEEMEELLSKASTPQEWLEMMCSKVQKCNDVDYDNYTAATVFYTEEDDYE